MSAPRRHHDNVSLAILLVVGFAVVIPAVTGSVKALGQGGMVAAQIAWMRFALQVVVVGGVLFAANGRRIGAWPAPAWAFVARGVFITVGSGFLYAGLAVMPIADNSATLFIQPLILAALSALILKERVGLWRWSAILVGFAGALLIIGPNFDNIGWAALLPALAALSFACAILITRAFRAHGSALVFQFTTAVTACAALTVALAIGTAAGVDALTPVWPKPAEWALLGIVGIVAALTNFMLTQAFRTAPSSVLAPFLYLEIVGAVVMGLAAFGDVPRPEMIVGAAIVIGSGLVVWWREIVRKTAADDAESVPQTRA